MSQFRSNPNCRCARCRLRGMMAPAVLITLGVLFLLDNLGARGFHDTWPLLLIVIGIVKVLQYTAPTEGHIWEAPAPVYPPAYRAAYPPAYPQTPPATQANQYPPQNPEQGNQGVNNG